MRVAVGSQNPAKIGAVRAAFVQMGFHVNVVGREVESGVANQPISDEETIRGAVNRALSAVHPADGQPFDFGVGLEGGVVETPFGWFVCNWGAIANDAGIVGIGGGHRVQLPQALVDSLHKGEELGTIIDQWTGGKDIKKKEGTIGILTNNHLTRQSMFRDVVVCAFTRFLNPHFYEEP